MLLLAEQNLENPVNYRPGVSIEFATQFCPVCSAAERFTGVASTERTEAEQKAIQCQQDVDYAGHVITGSSDKASGMEVGIGLVPA